MTLPITTERLVLRRYSHDDIPDLLSFVSHPSVARATPEITATEAGIREYIDLQNSYQPFEQDKCFDLAVQRQDGGVIGLLSLVCKRHRQGSIGWGLNVKHRGQGFATEAARALITYCFTVLGLHRVHATTSHRNTASWAVMERLGMRREAHLQEAELRDGEWLDVFVYGILEHEWTGGRT